MEEFSKFGKQSRLSVNMILDYEDLECPYAIYKRNIISLYMLSMVRQITMHGTIEY